jgi:transcriptional regulator GlxA family with amidase domain
MRSVGVILIDDFQIMGLAALSAFEFANRLLGEKTYRITVMSEGGGLVASSLGTSVDTSPLVEFPDTLMILGPSDPYTVSAALREYVSAAGEVSRRVAGVCTGAFALAEAGVLDGRSATTHWNQARTLQARYPLVKVNDDRIFIRDGNIWTSAGMSAGIDLALALIEEDHGAALARQIAQRLVVYYRRPGGQAQFSALLEFEPRTDPIRRALIYAKEHLRNPLSVEELADAAGLSPRQFSRRFKEETGQSPAKVVEQLRLEAARAMLEGGRHTIDIVAQDTGFSDRDRMRRAFVRSFGASPQLVRRGLLEGNETTESQTG